ncbi:MAG TPA: helix-turn-helix transcriptional regulator [Kofleriaceae bacterium]|nr:helix-turn-helix transcriptional regulator [Kofleriaceae bacterium]
MNGSSSGVGPQVRSWRLARRLSQEALAARADVSPRHLSFVENGRANPSRELVMALTEALDLPLRDRNTLLTLAGFAPVYRSSALDGEELRHLRRALDYVLAQQEPFGAVVMNGAWEILRVNQGAQRILSCFPPRSADGLVAARNSVLAVLHPDALRPYVVNWHEVASLLVARLHREAASTPSEARARLLAAALAMPEVPSAWRASSPGQPTDPFVTVHLRGPQLEVKLFSMLSTIGTPLDLTAEDLQVETYFPADEASEATLRELGQRAAPGARAG